MMNTRELINELRELNGANVRIFGQPTTLDDYTTCENDPIIDTCDFLKGIEEYELDIDELGIESEEVDDIIDELISLGYIHGTEYQCDNSYNWGSPLSHDIDFQIFQGIENDVYVALKVHRFGDIRCNYTDEVLYHFDSDYDFYESMLNVSKYIIMEIAGKEYEIYVCITRDYFEVYQDGEYITDVCGIDCDDIIEEITEYLSNN